jgi:hypothetical protein
MTNRASGTFEVKLNPLALNDTSAQAAKLARMSIDKQFQGELEAISKGEMLSAGTDIEGSAAYVALERVSGTLQGRTGSFILQHSAAMNRGIPQLSITVVPDSGTEELVGLAGQMSIRIEEGQHYYQFEYILAQTS